MEDNLLDETMLRLIDTVENQDMKRLLTSYKWLCDHPLDQEFHLYPGKGITNLMVICARGYFSLLLWKLSQLNSIGTTIW